MITLSIDNKQVEVPEGATVLDGAAKLSISIPTMCHREDCTPFTSCMVCVVLDRTTDKLVPACSALAQDGMDISTDAEAVIASRKTALELLLSDHIGDCEAPCQRVCPADINIPAMLRHIKDGEMDKAANIIREVAEPGKNPCDGCNCTCEKACRRSRYDASVSIRMLVQYALANGNQSNAESACDKIAFNCSIGRLIEGEMDEFLKTASQEGRIEPASGTYNESEAQKESTRCLHCDCLKQNNCSLRVYSDLYNAKQRKYAGTSRKTFKQVRQHSNIIYEPGKCIKCALCVQITERESEVLGLSFIGRGFDVEVGVPFNESLDKALTSTAQKCVEACPTAALAFRDSK